MSKATSKTVTENYQLFKEIVNDTIKKHIPQKTLGSRWNLPWLTNTITRVIRKKKRLYNKAKRSGNTSDWKNFKDLRKLFKKKTC